MSRRVRLLEFCQVMAALDDGYHTVLTPEHIHVRRCRVMGAGRPDPYPFLVREEGIKGYLVDIDAYDRWAASVGRPAWPKKMEMEESAR
jgi:hypothetical protein